MPLYSRVSSFLSGPIKRNVSLQILSDLHLEVGQQYSLFDFPRAAPYLILAGDIGRLSSDYDAYLSFLASKCCNRFERVFLVLGNHEFYGSSHDEVIDIATSKLEQEPTLNGRLVVLHRRRFHLPGTGITILGCTLYSRIGLGAEREAVKSKVKDFQRIEGWTVDKHNAEHEADLSWLHQELEHIRHERAPAASKAAGGQHRRVVVITHYAPCIHGTSDPRHANNMWNSAFATDLLPDAESAHEPAWESSPLCDVQWWIFGHTHFTTRFQRNGVSMISNQRGYVLHGNAVERNERQKKAQFLLKSRPCIGQWLVSKSAGGSDNKRNQFCPNKTILV